MIDNWTPEQQDIDWTQEHFNSMAVGDTWSVSGALIEKISDTELSLRQYPAEAALAAERVAKVCGEMGVVFNTEDAELIDDPMASAAAAASGWVCPESNIHLCNFDLQDAEWSVSAVPTQTNTGEAEITDQWTVRITHPNDDGEREEAVRYADDRESFLACLDNLSIALLGSTYNESPVPPHMRGMLVTKLTALGEEE